MNETWITVFGRDCHRAIGYNEKSADVVLHNDAYTKERINSSIKWTNIKQYTTENGKTGSILNILGISSQEFVRYFNFHIDFKYLLLAKTFAFSKIKN